MTDGYLNFNTKISTKGFEDGLKRLDSSFQTLRASIGSAAAAMGLGIGAKELIENAAAVNAETSALSQTFGTLEQAAAEAMRRVGDASGILETRLHGVGTQIFAFAKTSGMDSVTALSMMEDALTVAADSAAYYDRSLEETAATLQSFLKGNYANDAALGLSATETTRNAAAMRLYGRSFQELSEAQKQLTLLQMVKDANALSGAMGQAARESEGWENVLGNLKEAWRQLTAVLGQPVLRLATLGVQQLTEALSYLTAQAQAAVDTISRLFGWEETGAAAVTSTVAQTAAQQQDVTAAVSQTTNAQDALTSAVEDTAAAQENMLAGFDKITKLGGDEAPSVPDVAVPAAVPEIVPVVDTRAVVPAAEETAEKVEAAFDRLAGAFEPLKRAWDAYSPDLIASAQRTADSIRAMYAAIGDSLYDVWTNGTGEEIAGSILRTFTNVSDTIGSLHTRFTVAWEDDGTGDRIIQNAADHLLILLHTVEDVSRATSDWSQTVDFSPLLRSFAGVQEALTPLLERLSEGVTWVWENVLLPFGSWAIEDALPASLDVLSGALDVLDAAAAALEPYGKWLWDDLISPLADWTGEIITDGLEALAAVLHDVGDWIREHPDAAVAIGGLSAAFIGLYTALTTGAFVTGITNVGKLAAALGGLDVTVGIVVAGIAAWIYTITELRANWDDILDVLEESGGVFGFVAGWLEYVREDVEEFFDMGAFGRVWRRFWEGVGGAVYDITHKIRGHFTKAKDTFADNIAKIRWWYDAVRDYLKERVNAIPGFLREKLQSAYDSTIAPFEKVGDWAYDKVEAIKRPFQNIADWFRDIFSNAWQEVLNVFSSGGSVFQGIEAGISSVFTQTVNGLIDGINNVLTIPFWNISEALRLIREWSIWLPWAGDWYPFEWLPSFDIPQIPRLAQGTVVPANYGEFLAVLGDNKREAEVVSPISTIEEAVGRMLDRKLSGMVIEIHNNMKMDGRQVYKSVVRQHAADVAMTGRDPFADVRRDSDV